MDCGIDIKPNLKSRIFYVMNICWITCKAYSREAWKHRPACVVAKGCADGLAFGAFPGCITRCFTFTSRFLLPRPAKVTIYATRCRHFFSFFPLLFRCTKNLGMCEAMKDLSGSSSKKRRKRAAFAGSIWRSFLIGTAFMRHCDIIGLQMQPPKDADPDLRHSNWKGKNTQEKLKSKRRHTRAWFRNKTGNKTIKPRIMTRWGYSTTTGWAYIVVITLLILCQELMSSNHFVQASLCWAWLCECITSYKTMKHYLCKI